MTSVYKEPFVANLYWYPGEGVFHEEQEGITGPKFLVKLNILESLESVCIDLSQEEPVITNVDSEILIQCFNDLLLSYHENYAAEYPERLLSFMLTFGEIEGYERI